MLVSRKTAKIFTNAFGHQESQVVQDSRTVAVLGPRLRIQLRYGLCRCIGFRGDSLDHIVKVELGHDALLAFEERGWAPAESRLDDVADLRAN
jgi:hypothetical protein